MRECVYLQRKARPDQGSGESALETERGKIIGKATDMSHPDFKYIFQKLAFEQVILSFIRVMGMLSVWGKEKTPP